MRKEVIFAIFIGAIFGIAIVLGVKRINTTTNSTDTPQQNTANPQSSANEPQDTRSVFVAVSDPQQKDVITNTPVEISGLSLSNTWVVLLTSEDEYITKTDDTGEFNFEVELSGGLNTFKIIALDANGRQASEDLTLVYTTQLEQ